MTDDDETGNDWLEFFYKEMKPWVHYIPISTKATINELESAITWALNNDAAAEKIAQAGYDFVDTFLTVDNVECYWKELLQRYQKLLKYEVEQNPVLIKIEPQKDEL